MAKNYGELLGLAQQFYDIEDGVSPYVDPTQVAQDLSSRLNLEEGEQRVITTYLQGYSNILNRSVKAQARGVKDIAFVSVGLFTGLGATVDHFFGTGGNGFGIGALVGLGLPVYMALKNLQEEQDALYENCLQALESSH